MLSFKRGLALGRRTLYLSAALSLSLSLSRALSLSHSISLSRTLSLSLSLGEMMRQVSKKHLTSLLRLYASTHTSTCTPIHQCISLLKTNSMRLDMWPFAGMKCGML